MRKFSKKIISIILITILLMANLCITSHAYDGCPLRIYVVVENENGEIVEDANISINGDEDASFYTDNETWSGNNAKVFEIDDGGKSGSVTVKSGNSSLKFYYNEVQEVDLEVEADGYSKGKATIPTVRKNIENNELYLLNNKKSENEGVTTQKWTSNKQILHQFKDEGYYYVGVKLVLSESEPQTQNASCDVTISEIEGIGKTLNIMAKDNSETSMSIANIVRLMAQNEITVNEILDADGSTTYSDDLEFLDDYQEYIGTGYKIITDTDEEYTVIVYGDTTGDGLVDSYDISKIIDYFLGIDTDISQECGLAADIEQDENINAADISRIINCFLGTLDGSILHIKEVNDAPDSAEENDNTEQTEEQGE